MSLWSFQGAREIYPPHTETPAESAGLSKLSSVRENNVEVDVILGELNSRTEAETSINGFNAYRNEFPDSLERR
jgi:hypothetical protein